MTLTGFSPDNAVVDDVSLSADGRQLYVLSGLRLSLYDVGEDGPPRLRQQVALARTGPVRITPLPADGSLLVRDGEQGVTLWSDIPVPGGSRLTAIRRFAGAVRPDARIVVSPQRPLFGVLSVDGAFELFSARESAVRWSTRLLAGARVAFSPRDDGIIGVDEHGWHSWRLDLASVEISWRTLTQKVWYSHYPAPAWTWQSTTANGRDSGKFSLVPLLAGTLKAAGYAMLFATPLALAAAMYTAWFMAPGLRRVVKPAMEIMGAVPSVIIGLIAGVWLAPHFSRVLSGVLLLPLILPLAVLAAGWGVNRLPAGWRDRFAPGWDCLVLLPLVALTVYLMCRFSPLLDRMLFGLPLSERLGELYNPMNALVVGIAMGFALIPLMFSLAEDSLFTVPVRLIQGSLALGATPWQTLLGVTLPTAAAGLFSALILGLGRAIGETMIILMASGNMPRVDGSLFQGLRALAANIAIEIPEAAQNGEHYRILLLTALVLFVFTFIINTLAETLRMRLRERFRQQDGENG
ncbi:phosphate ABC transporter permease [Acerihabitans sp. KWT182]|uniref:Phosphate ABC transporter permease n=1 Tax=Acerihabitans sp. KWT182 TaxID=3157919 RepID=A0AAU7Q6I7_9GAMM